MPNENQMVAGAGLDLWFAHPVANLVGAIRLVSGAGGSAGIGPGNAHGFLSTIREHADQSARGVDEALTPVLHEIRAIEALTGNIYAAATDPDYAKKVEVARTRAVDALSRLVDVLGDAPPSFRAKALFPQPGQAGYRLPEPV
jgi:hypothetical protein